MKRREEPIPALSACLSHLVMGGLVVLAVLPAFDGLRQEMRREARVSPETRPAAGSAQPSTQQSPVHAPPAAPPSAAGATQMKEEWTQSEITRAKEQCMHVLAGTSAEVEWLEPIRKGECGHPAPVRLVSLGLNPRVVFDPPVAVSCPMVDALGSWVKSTLQPNARERLKSEVVRIVGGGGYSCRNIYNRPNARLSQHALANAIDIGGFRLANGKTISVLKGWGLTKRDIEAQAKAKALADAKAKAVADAKAKKAPDKKDKSAAAQSAKAQMPESKVIQASTSPLPLTKTPAAAPQPAAAPAEPPKLTKEAQFLRAIHEDACQEFGTVLGPEANDPHRNHFHFDLISRSGRAYCR